MRLARAWISSSRAFTVGRMAPPNAVRVCLGAPIGDAELERALSTIAAVAQESPELCLSVV